MGGRNSIRYVLENSLPYTKKTCNETISELHYVGVQVFKFKIRGFYATDVRDVF